MKEYKTITIKQDEETPSVYILTLNRPNALNAFTTQMALDIIDCLRELKGDGGVSALIITGKGDRGFCVGADLKERNGMTKKDWKEQHDIFEDMAEAIREFEFPVIAAVNGFALGGGMEIALSCDFRYAADHAQLGLPEAKLGIIPGIGGTQLLPRIIPTGLAKEILYRGGRIPAEKAKECGLVNAVFPADELMAETIKTARDIGRNAPLSLKSLKKAVDYGLQADLHTGLMIELQAYYKCADSEDRLEGVTAFNEKRPPVWKGR